MGQSTNAILFYGYAYDDEATTPWHSDDEEEDDSDWEDRWAHANGVLEPDVPYGNEPRGVETPARTQHRAYWDAKRTLVQACPVVVGTHCSGDCPMYFVAVSTSKKLARRGSPESITSTVVGEDWDRQLHEFMEKMGIAKPPGQERPGWWLVSDWC